MIKSSIDFSFKSEGDYSRSLLDLRLGLCIENNGYYILKDRKEKGMTRHAIVVQDEKGDSKIELCMMGNTLYILAMRLPGGSWLKTKKQPAEFANVEGHIMGELPFEGGYGSLGITPGGDLANFVRNNASVHALAMEEYITAWTKNVPRTERQETACKLAFAYFAMTIAEAARFKTIETMMETGGISPGPALAILQAWVIKSSVRNDKFPHNEVAIVGIHENKASPIFKQVVDNLNAHEDLKPSTAELAGNNDGAKEFLAKSGIFAGTDELSKKEQANKEKSKHAYGYEFLLDAYFRSRAEPGLMDKARNAINTLSKSPKALTMNSFKGLKIN